MMLLMVLMVLMLLGGLHLLLLLLSWCNPRPRQTKALSCWADVLCRCCNCC
jgi:hypothetical protein